jgi:hypothetical protein
VKDHLGIVTGKPPYDPGGEQADSQERDAEIESSSPHEREGDERERAGAPGLITGVSPPRRDGYTDERMVSRGRGNTSGPSMVMMTVVIYGALLLGALIWGWLDGGRSIWVHPGHRMSLEHLRHHGLWGALAGVAFGLVVVVGSRAVTALFDWGKRLHMEFHAVIQGLSTRDAFVIAAFSAVGEEALFRGALQPTAGLWISAAVFGVVHAPVRRGLWPWPLLAFGMGVAFGLLYRHGGDLAGPILAHLTVNFFNLRHIARVQYPDHAPPEDRQPPPGPAPEQPRPPPARASEEPS